ncbi:MAG: (E)-4-hydroxy-3-methylbut-2-enyl-diphosphate synthase [Chitinophagaceae bacterium]|nr:(E)-4-hydroxy-3-methylbut-2-enyl-diphosphate synthase [Chitinophagaceae bacterium]
MKYLNEHIKPIRLITREVNVGGLLIGNNHPIRVQTMTTTDTMDTKATVEQCIRCIEAGAELVRITAPSKNEAENLLHIKNELRARGYTTPLVADIHFTPNAAEIAARIVEKVRVNPGNYVDKKKFEQIEYTDAEYNEEIERIRERFTPLVKICKEYGTAMRIGTNHGSLSDRIMSRYGDTAIGMVESAMEFLRIARDEDYHNIILSMKSSNPIVMVEAYRLLVDTMDKEFGEIYPLHLGVTEAGDGEDGRIKSAIGIGTLLQDGIGDTIRVSLTEDPEFEIPVCVDLVKINIQVVGESESQTVDRRPSTVNGQPIPNSQFQIPIVVADFMMAETITHQDLQAIGYTYNEVTDKWNIADAAADFIYAGNKIVDFALPGTLKVLVDVASLIPPKEGLLSEVEYYQKYYPLFQGKEFLTSNFQHPTTNFIALDVSKNVSEIIEATKNNESVVYVIYSNASNGMQQCRAFARELSSIKIHHPVIIAVESHHSSIDEQLIHFAQQAGALFLDGIGNGIWLMNDPAKISNQKTHGRTYLPVINNHQFLNNTSFGILQATRKRISKTEYISCPSCGRTLFDLQETTAKIRNRTNHLKGLKIAIMGCIVNGPGEMADADFGYVGSGVGKITLYKGKEVVKKNIESEVAVDELINLLKENDAWIEPS